MPFNYLKFVNHLQALGKRREAWFIRKFYIERKGRDEIISEMYMNSRGYFYSVKKRVKLLIEKNYAVHKFLDEK